MSKGADMWRCLRFGVRANPMGLFVVALLVLAGLGFVFGVADPGSVEELLNPVWLRYFGALLLVGAGFMGWGIMRSSAPAEKLGCRLISICMVVFAIWVLLEAHAAAIVSAGLALLLAGLCEVRVSVLRRLLNGRGGWWRWTR